MVAGPGESRLAVRHKLKTIRAAGGQFVPADFRRFGPVLESIGLLGTTGTSAIWGSPVQGAQAGDRVLAAGANEVFCVNVTLPLAATNASQGATTTATFTFDAEQTANNP